MNASVSLFVMSRHDLSDEKRAVTGRKLKDDRRMFNGIFVDSENRNSPEGFTGGIRVMECCSSAFSRMDKTWDDMLRMRFIKADRCALIIDAAFIRAYQHAAGAKEGTSDRTSDEQEAC